MYLKGTPVEELKAEFGRLQAGLAASNPRDTIQHSGQGETVPQKFTKCTTILRKLLRYGGGLPGIAPLSADRAE